MYMYTIFLTLFHLFIVIVNTQKGISSTDTPLFISTTLTGESTVSIEKTTPRTTENETSTFHPLCIVLDSSENETRPSICAHSLKIPSSTHKYIGGFIIICFVIGQTIHYFYLEERKGRALKKGRECDGESSNQLMKDEHHDEEEKDRRERLAYGISTNSYLVAEMKTPGGRITKVLEKRRKAIAPPITPATSINGPYESRTKTVQKEEAMICHIQITADKWGRGNELISLIKENDDIPSSCMTSEEKAKFAMEKVQQLVEKMTEQKVFLHGFLEDKTRILCGSENLETEIFSEVRLEIKLEMTAPVHLLISVFSVKMEPQIEQPNPIIPVRVSELTSIPNKETPKAEVPPTPKSNKKGKSIVASSLEEKQQGSRSSSRPAKVIIQSPDKRERRDSSKGKGGKKTDLTDQVPLLQQVQSNLGNEKKEKQRTPKESPMPTTPEKPSSGQMPPMIKKKKKESSSGQGSSSLPN